MLNSGKMDYKSIDIIIDGFILRQIPYRRKQKSHLRVMKLN